MGFSFLQRQTKILKRVENFLDLVSESGLLFKHGIEAYLSGNEERFLKKLEQVNKTEHVADELRRDLERQLYIRTIIPESRGDVLALLECLDRLVDQFKNVLFQFEIERPAIDKKLNEDFALIAGCATEAVESVVLSARAFFNNLPAVSDHMHKVSYWESETDMVSTRLQRTVFRDDSLDLSYKMQLRDFVKAVDFIADEAEDAADQLSIYVIKRTL